MKASWKKNKHFKPEIILEKIESLKVIDGERLSFQGFGYHDAMGFLQNMVEFPRSQKNLNQARIVSKAVSNIAKTHKLDKTKVIDEINEILASELKTREDHYHLLTSISINPPLPRKRITSNGAVIRLIRGGYPKKYAERNGVIKASRLIDTDDATPTGYTKVIVSLKAKSEQSAATEALRIIDLYRAIWSLYSNPGMELFNNQWLPINKIRLGGAHTIHHGNGKHVGASFWYEPLFNKAPSFFHKNPNLLKQQADWVLQQLGQLSYSRILEDVLVRYVRAFDERDPNVSLIKIWSAVEALTAPNEANCDLISKRISFLVNEPEYHCQAIENIREYRNRSVHAGDQSELAKSYCYQMQSYLFHLIHFHLIHAETFRSINEANTFLELPKQESELKKRKKLLEDALEFRGFSLD